jgi:two-component system, NarL family, invasion response regulator UvrY
MVGVLTVDDQAVFRAAARDVIEATPGFSCAGEAASGEEALQLAGELDPELALVDVRMPGMDGVETARRLRALAPELVVVLISIEDAANLPSSVNACDAAALIRKQDLRPALLSELWARWSADGAARIPRRARATTPRT